MQARLRALGLRPINALVDITNYLTFEPGPPAPRLRCGQGAGRLVVRRARDGEALKALDGKTYALTGDTVVIADDHGVESIAGIIGGEASGCDCRHGRRAHRIGPVGSNEHRQSGRRLGIITDARYRFRAGVDPAFTLPGLDLATRLVLEICGGTASQPVIAGEPPVTERVIDFPWTETRRLAGIELSRAEMKVTLEALGFHVAGTGDRVKVLTPSWRPDVEGKADLVEEIVRIAGLDRIEPKPLARIETVGSSVLTVMQKRTRLAKRALASRGLRGGGDLVVHSARRRGAVRRRRRGSGAGEPHRGRPLGHAPEPGAGLLRAVQRNADRGNAMSPCSRSASASPTTSRRGRPPRRRRSAGAPQRTRGRGVTGTAARDAVDAFDAKADALGLLAALGVPTVASRSWRAGRTGCIPVARGPCSSGRRTRWGISARCIHA